MVKEKSSGVKTAAKQAMVYAMIASTVINPTISFGRTFKRTLPEESSEGYNIHDMWISQSLSRYEENKDKMPRTALYSLSSAVRYVGTKEQVADLDNKYGYTIGVLEENGEYFGAANECIEWAAQLEFLKSVSDSLFTDPIPVDIKGWYKRAAEDYFKQAKEYQKQGSNGEGQLTVKKLYSDAMTIFQIVGDDGRTDDCLKELDKLGGGK